LTIAMRTDLDPSLCPISRQSRREELVNSLIHGLGLVFALAALVVLVVRASLQGDAWHVVSFSVYGASLVLLYGISTLYHATLRVSAKRVLQRIDHGSVFLLIAGTYTPVTLVTLHGGWGWSLFGVVWGLAGVGVVLKAMLGDRFEITSTLIYLAMGWLGLVAIGPLLAQLPPGGIFWLVVGGVAYSVGTLFYLWERLPFHHAVWHVFVLTGSVCHFILMLRFVLPEV
jgi:hemolysin III